MTWKAVLAFVCCGLTVALSWALQRRRREHRPFAIWASAMLAADLTRLAFQTVFPWLNDAGPWSGWRRVVFHLDATVLFNSWPIGLATLGWAVFLRRRPWIPLLAGAVVLLVLVLGYPAPFRGDVLGRAYACIEGAALAVSLIATLAWARRLAAPRPEHAATLLVTLLDLAYFGGPLALPDPWVSWIEADMVALAMWAGLAAMHALSLFDDFLMLPDDPVRPDLH